MENGAAQGSVRGLEGSGAAGRSGAFPALEGGGRIGLVHVLPQGGASGAVLPRNGARTLRPYRESTLKLAPSW